MKYLLNTCILVLVKYCKKYAIFFVSTLLSSYEILIVPRHCNYLCSKKCWRWRYKTMENQVWCAPSILKEMNELSLNFEKLDFFSNSTKQGPIQYNLIIGFYPGAYLLPFCIELYELGNYCRNFWSLLIKIIYK